jgi:hypothetical protein
MLDQKGKLSAKRIRSRPAEKEKGIYHGLYVNLVFPPDKMIQRTLYEKKRQRGISDHPGVVKTKSRCILLRCVDDSKKKKEEWGCVHYLCAVIME